MTTDSRGALSWLPAHLVHVALRLGRADDLEAQLGRTAFGWSSKEGGPLTLKQVRGSEPGTLDTVVTAIRPIPPLAAMLFSEAVHHLRAVLDNVVFDCVTLARGTELSDDDARKVALPIYQSASDFAEWQRRVRRRVPELDGGTDLGQRIESLQPYNSSEAVASIPELLAALMSVEPERIHPLLLLQGYSNEDKHRAIRMAYMRSIIQRSDKSFYASDRTMREVSVGDILGSTTVGHVVMLESNAALLVQRPSGSDTWVGPGAELNALHSYVADAAIPTLVTGTAHATPPLPRSVELKDNDQTAEERIATGGDVPAHIRIGEETVRYVEQSQIPPQVLDMPDDD